MHSVAHTRVVKQLTGSELLAWQLLPGRTHMLGFVRRVTGMEVCSGEYRQMCPGPVPWPCMPETTGHNNELRTGHTGRGPLWEGSLR